ncbi:MAG: replicative DNA helicase [Cyanobacteria bacterium]|jgi:replicative DNA helicase|nr:replicative DNA helicase [Cyanobacteria bacterium GSL.Bin1]
MTEFSPLSDQSLPPQNVEAEESILGGILLDPEAIARVAEILPAEAFYLQAHQTIYRGAIALQTQGKPTDLMNLSTWLADQELLDKVGGKAKLAQLADRTVSAVNIDGYAQLVLDKYLRRQLINAGHKIVQFGFDTTEALNTILDRAEQSIFAITQERPQSGLVPLSETLIETYDQIEGLYYQEQLPGLKSSFYDLDSMTSGLQPSDLIILAGRPSMGKTAFGLNIARNIAGTYQAPVALFSLEMSKEQLSQRLLASEAKIESNRLRSGRLSQQDYQKLSSAIGTLSEVPIFIDDTATLTVMEMRSQARRLQAEHGQLGLVLLDYLQLMEGGGDNRVQELSRITRSLKTLARELKAPVIALSQLSRGVEQRTNKRPMLSDLRESGCLSGDTLVTLADTGEDVPIKNLVGQSGFNIWAVNPDNWKMEKAPVSRVFSTGVKPTFELKTALGPKIIATGNHKFLTLDGWVRLDQLQCGNKIALPPHLPETEITTHPNRISKQSTLTHSLRPLYLCGEKHSFNFPITSPSVANPVYWDKIISLTPSDSLPVYDLTVPRLHNFVANNIIVHNSIEQDADLVLMLYRDAYYNPDTPDRDLAELIITKHRNGPTGTVKLIFNAELTEFRNMARYDHESNL